MRVSSTYQFIQFHKEVVMLKGISDTNTEEQILRSIDVLKDLVLSSRTDANQRFDRVESEFGEFRTEVNQRFEHVESDIGEIRNDIKEVRNEIQVVRTDVIQRFEHVESEIGEIKESVNGIQDSIEQILLRLPLD